MSEIPSTWEWSTIGDVTQYIQRGKSPKYAEQSVLPVINQKCSRWYELQLKHLKYIHPDQIDAWDEPRYIKPGDILWNSTGTGTVGRAYLVKSEDTILPKVVDSHVTIVRAVPDLEPRYLFNWIKSPAVQDKIEDICDGTTNQIELSRTAIAATAIPIAPRAEQIRIADQLDSLLARVNACNDHIDAIPGILKRFRQAVLGAASSGALTEKWRAEQGAMPAASELCKALVDDHAAFGGHERGNASEPTQEAHDLTVNQLPQGWAITTLRECCVPGRPITYGILKPGPELDVGVPYIRVADFPGNKLNLSSIKKTSPEIDLQYKRARLASGDLLLSIRGSVGRLIVIPPSLEGANITQDTARLSISNRLNAQYVYYALLSPDAQRRMSLAIRGVAVRGINIGDVRALQVPLPPLPEQVEIAQRLNELFALADMLEARWNKMRQAAQRLPSQVLAKAFRGDLVEQNTSDEPATALLARLASQREVSSLENKGRRVRQPHATRKPVQAASMNKSRQDEDVKGQPYLAGHLRRLGIPTTAQALFKEAELPVADFYKQLAWEIAEGHVKDNQTTLEPGHATG